MLGFLFAIHSWWRCAHVLPWCVPVLPQILILNDTVNLSKSIFLAKMDSMQKKIEIKI